MANSKKKRFGASNPLLQGIVETVRGNELSSDEVNVEIINLSKVTPDPKNPRSLGLTEDELSWLKNDGEINNAREEGGAVDQRIKTLLKLRDLADSIKSNGVLQPIRVYRLGEGFRIESGERRYWGALIAKEKKVPAIILKAKPARLRTFQLIENLQREDLSLPAKLRNIASVVDELEEEEGGAVLTNAALGEVIGTSRRQASKYLSVIRGHGDIMSAITAGVISDINVAVELTKIVDPVDLKKTIKAYENGLPSVDVSKSVDKKKSEKASAKGRRATRVSLGHTKSVATIKHIMSECGANEDVDWEDFKAVSTAWAVFLSKVESEL